MLVDYIDQHRDWLGVEPICAVLKDAGVQIAPSTYYAAKTRPPSARSVRDAALIEDIKVAHRANLGVLRRSEDPRRAQPRRREGCPLHRRAADARRGAAWDPAGEDPQDHHRRRRGDRAARGPGQAQVHRHGAEPAVGGRSDLRQDARRLDLRRVRPRRLLPDDRGLAGVHVVCGPIWLWTPSTWGCGVVSALARTSPV